MMGINIYEEGKTGLKFYDLAEGDIFKKKSDGSAIFIKIPLLISRGASYTAVRLSSGQVHTITKHEPVELAKSATLEVNFEV